MPSGHPTPREVEDSVIEMWLAGRHTQRQVAEHHGLTLRQIERALARGRKRGIDIPVQDARPITPEEEARIIAMLEEGTPYAEVAATLGRNASRLGTKYPGYTLPRGEITAINHMRRRFERLVEALGLDDTAHYSH